MIALPESAPLVRRRHAWEVSTEPARLDIAVIHEFLARVCWSVGLRRFSLVARDAHRRSARFGFTPLAAPERHRERFQADVYRGPE